MADIAKAERLEAQTGVATDPEDGGDGPVMKAAAAAALKTAAALGSLFAGGKGEGGDESDSEALQAARQAERGARGASDRAEQAAEKAARQAVETTLGEKATKLLIAAPAVSTGVCCCRVFNRVCL